MQPNPTIFIDFIPQFCKEWNLDMLCSAIQIFYVAFYATIPLAIKNVYNT